MRPFLFYSPHFAVPSFAFMLMMASLVATTLSYKMAPRRGLSQVAVLDLGIIGTIMAVVGGRLFHVFVEGPLYASPGFSNYYWEHPTHIWQIWRGGFVSYGGFLGMGVGWVIYCQLAPFDPRAYLDYIGIRGPLRNMASSLMSYVKVKLDIWAYLDHIALFAGPFIDFFVRLGCLMAGCCYGKPSPYRHGEYLLYIVFNNRGSDAGNKFPGIPLWPTQIYSLIAAVLIFFICLWIDHRKQFKGQVMMSFLMLYAVFRSAIEMLRGDSDRGVWFHNTISTAQIMSILFFVTCTAIYFYLKKRYSPRPTNPSAGTLDNPTSPPETH